MLQRSKNPTASFFFSLLSCYNSIIRNNISYFTRNFTISLFRYLTIFRTLALTNLIILTFLFSSCSDDNPVKTTNPPPVVDTLDSLFTWQFLNIPGYFIEDIYVYDTNNIYLAIPAGIVAVHGNNYFPIYVNDTAFAVNVIGGYDNSNIFLGGSNPWIFKSRLKKWDGSNFSDILLPLDSSVGVENILVRTPDDVWIGVGRDKIYHYDGFSIQTYDLLSRVLGPTFFADSVGTLYLFGSSPTSPSTSIFYVYKFDGTQWQVVESDGNNNMTDYVNICGSTVVRSAKDGIYKFTSTSWELITSFINMQIDIVGGKSSHELLLSGGIINNSGYSEDIYHWNGEKLAKQKNYHPPFYATLYGIKSTNNYYYGYNKPDDPFDSYLVIASRKQ